MVAEARVPAPFVEMIEVREGETGEAWTRALPSRLADLLVEWSLSVSGETRFGYVGIVVPVQRADGTPAALKVSFPDGESVGEAPSLAAWDGDGAARLLAQDATGFSLLLEGLDPDRSLFALPVDEGIETIGGLMARLHARTAPSSVRRLSEESVRWLERVPADWHRYCRGEDRRLLDAALDTFRDLGPDAGERLLHGDLHYGNVLAGSREPWLAIDPKGLAGDPAYDVIPCVWNRLDELFAEVDPEAAVRWRVDLLCDAAGIDSDRACRWTLARAIENITWARATGNDDFGGAELLIASALLPRVR
jgi:streptomycin 6-kinase